MSEMRSQRIPSFMKCVVTKIVTPCLRERSTQQLPEAVARDRIDAGGGLIEDQQLRPVEHRDCEREPLAQAHRQRIGQRIEMRTQSESLDQLVDAGLCLVGRDVKEARIQDEVLADVSSP